MWSFARGLGPIATLTKPSSSLAPLPGVADTQVVFNNKGQLQGNASFTFSATVLTLQILAISSVPAQSGSVRLGNSASIRWRNFANNGDFAALTLTSGSHFLIGQQDSTNIRMAGQVRCDLDTASRIVLPVGAGKYAV